jgi:hypothetical protein
MKQKIEPLNENEVRWVTAQLEEAVRFVGAFSPADAVGSAWISTEPAGNEINPIINFAGIAFGQVLVDADIGLKWPSPRTSTAPRWLFMDCRVRVMFWYIRQISSPRDGSGGKSIFLKSRTV